MDYEKTRKNLNRQELTNLRCLERLLIGDSYEIDELRIEFTTGSSTARSFHVYEGDAQVDQITVSGLRDDKNAFLRIAMVKWLAERSVDLSKATHKYAQ